MYSMIFDRLMLAKIIQIQQDIAGLITLPLTSKGTLNLLFLIVVLFGITQAILNHDYDASFYVAVLPAVLLIFGAWINFTNRVTRWLIMQQAPTSTMPPSFRSLGFFFFLAGATFHCIDFLGVEETLEWGGGLVFLAAILLTIVFWLRFTIKRKIWQYVIWCLRFLSHLYLEIMCCLWDGKLSSNSAY